MTADALPTATLAIYAVLSVPVFFCLVRHGKTGLLGWLYLLAFCTLRIVSGAMSMSSSSSSSASIIANVGLSPLLLAASGILHEGRAYRVAGDKKMEWLLVLVFHAIVTPGVALLATGASGLLQPNATSKDLVLVNVGIALLVAAWLVLCICAALSLRPSSRQKKKEGKVMDIATPTTAHGYGTKLLLGVAAALPFIGIRVLYSLVALTTRLPYLNPSTGALSIRVVIVFLPELIACIVLIVAGLVTQRVAPR
ncbi:integral membrane protein [Apiospora phragmitis]|uniref:Integral membrane protein n=1 Tax=Apiospora phragmitis TaxID=2905665 RepID=A0ABR1W5K8_9PEZI